MRGFPRTLSVFIANQWVLGFLSVDGITALQRTNTNKNQRTRQNFGDLPRGAATNVSAQRWRSDSGWQPLQMDFDGVAQILKHVQVSAA